MLDTESRGEDGIECFLTFNPEEMPRFEVMVMRDWNIEPKDHLSILFSSLFDLL